MHTSEHTIAVTTSTKVSIVFLGDTHIGSSCFRKPLLQRAVEEIAALSERQPTVVILTGDLIEAITTADKRFDFMAQPEHYGVQTLADIGNHQIADILETLAPIASLVRASAEGNHERSLRKYNSLDASQNIVNGLPNCHAVTRGVGHLRLHLHKTTSRAIINIMYRHGVGGGGGTTAGLVYNKMGGMFHRFPDCDIGVAGHNHRLAEMRLPTYRFNIKGEVVPSYTYRGFAGCFYQKYVEDTTNYAEEGETDTDVGFLEYELSSSTWSKKDIVVTPKLHDYHTEKYRGE